MILVITLWFILMLYKSMSAIVLNTGSFCTHLHGFERYTKALKGKSAADDNEIAKMFPLMR